MFQFIFDLLNGRTAQEKEEVEFELWQKGFISRARDEDVQRMLRTGDSEVQCFFMALVTTRRDVAHLDRMCARVGLDKTIDFLSDTFGVDRKVIVDRANQ
jgi:hypothetical protein